MGGGVRRRRRDQRRSTVVVVAAMTTVWASLYDHVGQFREELGMAQRRDTDRDLEELLTAAHTVIDSWETGDLAEAVRELDSVTTAIEAERPPEGDL
jgi:hypothetical protein